MTIATMIKYLVTWFRQNGVYGGQHSQAFNQIVERLKEDDSEGEPQP